MNLLDFLSLVADLGRIEREFHLPDQLQPLKQKVEFM